MSLLPFVAWSREQRDFHLELQHQGLVSRNHGDEVEESSDLGPNAEQDNHHHHQQTLLSRYETSVHKTTHPRCCRKPKVRLEKEGHR